MKNHHFTKEYSKKGRKELQNSQKTINSMTIVSSYLSIITLNVNGFNSPVKRHTMTEWVKKTRLKCMLPTRESLQLQVHTQIRSELMEKDIPCKWKPKDSKCTCTYVT